MLCLILIMVSVLPSFMFADVPPTGKTKTNKFCNESSVIETGDKFFKSFNDAVNQSLTASKSDLIDTDIKKTLLKYGSDVKKSCFDDKNGSSPESVELIYLLKYSLGQSFKDFVEKGGVKCIAAVKQNITQCSVDTVGVIDGANDKYQMLWRKTKPVYQVKSCDEAVKLKECVLKAIRVSDDCTQDLEVSLYVRSLFEVMLNICSKLLEGKEPPKPTSALPLANGTNPMRKFEPHPKADGTTNALLGVVLALILVSMLYVLVRDCRASTTNSKTEIFPLTTRIRNSLVHHEGQ